MFCPTKEKLLLVVYKLMPLADTDVIHFLARLHILVVPCREREIILMKSLPACLWNYGSLFLAALSHAACS